MTWFVVVGTLLGTVTGATGTIASQILTTRAVERKEQSDRIAARRAESHTAIEAFFEVYQEMERIADSQLERASELSHRMWFLHNRLALIGSDELQEPLADLANKLNEVYWNGTPGGQPVYLYLNENWNRLRHAARSELGRFESNELR